LQNRKKTQKRQLVLADPYLELPSEIRSGFALIGIICNESGKTCDGRFLEVNAVFEQMAGVKAETLIGKTIQEVFPGEKSFWVDQCGSVALTGKPIQFSWYLERFNGSFRVMVHSPQKDQVAIIITDITAKMRMETSLREKENNFRAIAENANDGILIAVEEGLHVYANRRASEITGYSPDILSKIGFINLVHPDEIDSVLRRYQKMREGRPVSACYETVIVKKNGAFVPIEITSSLTSWQRQIAVLRIFRDITLRRWKEKTMDRAYNKLEQRVKERTNELKKITEELEKKQKELLQHKSELETVNEELKQTNTALSVLARNIAKNKQGTKNAIGQTINSKIMPIVDKLREAQTMDNLNYDLDILAAHLREITADLMGEMNILATLTPAEMRVAAMLKNGLTSQNIARHFNISLNTAKTHRRNIRKKLRIQNLNLNLATYLRYLMD
jgi:PAS domain S-box-containing protein